MGFARMSYWRWTLAGCWGGGGGWRGLGAGRLHRPPRLCPVAPRPMFIIHMHLCFLHSTHHARAPRTMVRPPRPCPPGLEANGGGNHGGRGHSPHGALEHFTHTSSLGALVIHPTHQETSTEGLSQ